MGGRAGNVGEDMEIVSRRLKDIRPYENNPRDNEAAVEYVKNNGKRKTQNCN